MARPLVLVLDGVEYPVSITKIDRDKLYGRVEIEAFDEIGDPVPGALQFAKKLSKFADITIFTSRCSQDILEGSRITPAQLRIKVISWLEEHKIPFTDVYIGQGKPKAAAFIDDRAVHCDPQSDEGAFTAALTATKALLK